MKAGLFVGITREITSKVTDEMCPAFEGKVIHRCYSTWSLVHHMELAARKVLIDFLEDDEEALGVHVAVDHLAPCRVGRTVRMRAEVTGVSHGRVVCRITAFEGERLLARGTHIHAVMDKSRVRRHIERNG